MVPEVTGLGIADGDGSARLQEQHGLRFTHNIGCAHHHGMCAAHRVVDGFQHFHNTIRRAGAEQWLTRHQQAGITDVEAIHVFFGGDCFDHFV